MDGKEDKASEEEHGNSTLHSQLQRDEDSAEVAEEEPSRGRNLQVLDLLRTTTPEEDTGEDLFSYNTSLTSSPVAAKRVSFSTLSSPRIGGPSLSPSSSRNFTNNSLKNMIPKPNFKNNRISNINEVDIEKAASLALASGRDRSSWTLSNIFTPRTRRNKTESLPITPIVHSNPGSTHGRYVADPVTSMKKGTPVTFHRSRSVPPFNKDGSLRRSGVFRVIPTPNMSPTRSLYRTNMKDTSVDGGEDLPEDEAVCRICLVELGEDSEAFKMECMCRGELALAHKECTIKWFTIKGNRTCDVCKQEVQNLPVTLLRMQDSQGEGAETSHYSIWQDVPVLVIVSMLAYFAFLEQLLLNKMKSSAIAISLPFSCILGLLASMTSTTMVEKHYVWIYSTVQFSFIVCFSHIFFELVHMQPIVSILLATMIGFGLTMSGTTGLVEFLKWRRRQRTAEPPSSSQEDPPPPSSSQEDPPPVQTDHSNSVS